MVNILAFKHYSRNDLFSECAEIRKHMIDVRILFVNTVICQIKRFYFYKELYKQLSRVSAGRHSLLVFFLQRSRIRRN